MNVTTRLRVAVVAAALLAACGDSGSGGPPRTTLPGASTTTPDSFRIAVWGDTPYSAQETEAFPRLIEDINSAGVDFTVMVGDIGGAFACEDAYYDQTVLSFDRFSAPLVYVVGDNEWTDCHEAGKDPLERLAKIRQVFFSRGESFGSSRLSLARQSADRPEHIRWIQDRVVFVGLNMPGSNNNHVGDADSPERQAAEAEFQARNTAVKEWLTAGFDTALSENAAGVVVAFQADPGFEVTGARRTSEGVDGYTDFLRALAVEARRFARPVVVLHGDSHQYRFDTPLIDPLTSEAIANVTRVEAPGSPDVGWAEVTLNPGGSTFVNAASRVVAAGGD